MRLADVTIVDAATGETQPGAAGLDLRVERGGVTVATSGNGSSSDIHRWPWSSIGGLDATTGSETPDGRRGTTLEVIVNGWPVHFLVPASELPPPGIKALQSMAPPGHPVALAAERRSSTRTHPGAAEADLVPVGSEPTPGRGGTLEDVSPPGVVRPEDETAVSHPSAHGEAELAAGRGPVAVMSVAPALVGGVDPPDEIDPVDEVVTAGLVDGDVPPRSEELLQRAQFDVVPPPADGAGLTANGWSPATNGVDRAGGAADPGAVELITGGAEHPPSRRSAGAVGAGAAALLAVAALVTAFSVTGNHGRSSGQVSRLHASNGAGIPHPGRRYLGNPGSTTSAAVAQASPPTVTTVPSAHAGVSTRTNFLPTPGSSTGTTAANGGSGGNPTGGGPTGSGGSGPVPPTPTTTQSTSPTTGSTTPPSTTTTSTSTTTSTTTTTPSSTTTTPSTTTTATPSGP